MSFEVDIMKFNAMYKLPIATGPSLQQIGAGGALDRLMKFKNILIEEVEEIDEIVADLQQPTDVLSEVEILTKLADLLGDIQVYCASEMTKFGLPIEDTLRIIMQSNFSKMGPDGPIYDERGKVLKGPSYWKPEPKIMELLSTVILAEVPK